MIVLIPYINLLNLSWIIKCLFLGNMELLNRYKLYNSLDPAMQSFLDITLWRHVRSTCTSHYRMLEPFTNYEKYNAHSKFCGYMNTCWS